MSLNFLVYSILLLFLSELYTSDKNIIEVAESLGLGEFARLMKTSGLSSELDPDARYTAFVPSDQAFSALPAETLKELFNNKKILRETLRLHLASGKIVTETMTDNRKITTLDGSQELRINVADDGKVIQLYMYSIVSECRSSRVAFLGAWFPFPVLSPFCSSPRFLVTPFSLFPIIFSL